jgi:hypothetical protein
VHDLPANYCGCGSRAEVFRAIFLPLAHRAEAGNSLVFSGNEVVMRRSRTIVQALFGATIVAGGLVALAPATQAITIPRGVW